MNQPHCKCCLELLYFEECPSYTRVWQDLLEVIAAGKIEACVRPVRITTTSEAEAHRFPGSPTVRVNGTDLEGFEGPGVLSCRMYAENEGKNWPSKSLLQRALGLADTA